MKVINKVYYKKEDDKQILKLAGGSWSINLDKIKGEDVEEIVYITQTKTYSIDYKTAHEKGFIRNFKDEVKLIVPIKYWRVK